MFSMKQPPVVGIRNLITMGMIPSLPYRLDRIMDFALFVMMAIREAIKENALHASAPQALYVSTANGMQRHPSSEHLARYLEDRTKIWGPNKNLRKMIDCSKRGERNADR